MTIRNPLLHTALAGLMTIGLSVASSVQAQPTALDSIMPSGTALFTDDSGENVFRQGEPVNGTIQQGDVLQGGIDITKLEDGGKGTFVNTTGRQFTSLFQIQVGNMQNTGQTSTYGGNTYQVWDYNFQAPGASAWDPYLSDSQASALGIDKSNLVALFYDDSTSSGTTFDRANGNASQQIQNASDGQLRAAVGLSNSNDFWIARGPNDLQAFQNANLNEVLGNFYFGGSWQYENFTRDFGTFTQNLGSNDIQQIAYAPGNSATVGLYGDGKLFGPTADSGFGVFDKANINVAGPQEQQIPEPATTALTGLGLMLMAAFGRRRFGRGEMGS